MKTIEPKMYRTLVDQFIALSQLDHKEEEGFHVISFPYEGRTAAMAIQHDGGHLSAQLFESTSDFLLLHEYMSKDNGKADSILRVNFIQMAFNDINEMIDMEYVAYQKAGFDLEDMREIPMFLSFKRGHSSWLIEEKDIDFMRKGMDIFQAVYAKHEGLMVGGHFDWDGTTLTSPRFFEIEEVSECRVIVSDALPMLTFRKRGVWLVGLYYLPFPIKMDMESREKHLMMCIIVDEEAEEIVHTFEFDPDLSRIGVVETLYDYMLKHKKRPRSVAFFDESDEECLGGLFEYLGVDLVESEEIYLLNEVWVEAEARFQEFLEDNISFDDNSNVH